MYPTCTQTVVYKGRGRLPLFCSIQCRQSYARDRRWLLEELEPIRLREHDDPSREAHLRWHLKRFPDLDADKRAAPPNTTGELVPRTTEPVQGWQMPPILWQLINDFDCARAAAKNVDTPQQILDRLSTYTSVRIRVNVAGNPSTSPQRLEDLCTDPAPRVREAAARNQNTPKAARLRALSDRARRVREAAGAPPKYTVEQFEESERMRKKAEVLAADPHTVAIAMQRVLTDTLISTIDVTPGEVRTIYERIGGIVEPLGGFQHSGLSITVVSELADHTFFDRISTTVLRSTNPPTHITSADIHIDDWVDLLHDQVTRDYDLPSGVEQGIREGFRSLMVELGITDPLASRSVRDLPWQLQVKMHKREFSYQPQVTTHAEWTPKKPDMA